MTREPRPPHSLSRPPLSTALRTVRESEARMPALRQVRADALRMLARQRHLLAVRHDPRWAPLPRQGGCGKPPETNPVNKDATENMPLVRQATTAGLGAYMQCEMFRAGAVRRLVDAGNFVEKTADVSD